MSVLILAEERDVSADRMVRALQGHDVEVHRVDLGWFPAQLSISAELRGGHWVGHLQTPARRIELGDIQSVLYRSPTSFRFPDALNAEERRHAFIEAKLGMGVLPSLDVLWVNHPARAADAAYKPVQLATAARCGLRVPPTLVTNSPNAVREFAQRSDIVCKTFGSNSVIERVGDRDVRRVAFTRHVTNEDLSDLRGVEVTAHQFQAWTAKDYEVRLTAVGDYLFSVAIHAGSNKSYVDWRADYGSLQYELIDTPLGVAAGVRQYMRSLDLIFGAFDFVVRPDGEWVFLECNPGGQYGWLEEPSGAPITDTLADLLATGGTS